jgi:hypothetical protein
MNEETLENAKQWFESMGYDVDIDDHSSLYLYLNGFSVQLSSAEIEARAEQWINELNRQD